MGRRQELSEAILSNDKETVEKMLNEHFDINNTNVEEDKAQYIMSGGEIKNSTPLYVACKAGNIEIIEMLINAGADPNISAYGDQYPLEKYCDVSYVNGVYPIELMVNAGADIEKYRLMPAATTLFSHYYRASEQNKTIIENEIDYLISQNVKWVNDSNRTAYAGYNFLHFVSAAGRSDYLKHLLEFDEAKKCINGKTIDGYTPLIFASINNRFDCCQILLDAGADSAATDNEGKTALDYAKEKGNEEIARLLEK